MEQVQNRLNSSLVNEGLFGMKGNEHSLYQSAQTSLHDQDPQG